MGELTGFTPVAEIILMISHSSDGTLKVLFDGREYWFMEIRPKPTKEKKV